MNWLLGAVVCLLIRNPCWHGLHLWYINGFASTNSWLVYGWSKLPRCWRSCRWKRQCIGTESVTDMSLNHVIVNHGLRQQQAKTAAQSRVLDPALLPVIGTFYQLHLLLERQLTDILQICQARTTTWTLMLQAHCPTWRIWRALGFRLLRRTQRCFHLPVESERARASVSLLKPLQRPPSVTASVVTSQHGCRTVFHDSDRHGFRQSASLELLVPSGAASNPSLSSSNYCSPLHFSIFSRFRPWPLTPSWIIICEIRWIVRWKCHVQFGSFSSQKWQCRPMCYPWKFALTGRQRHLRTEVY